MFYNRAFITSVEEQVSIFEKTKLFCNAWEENGAKDHPTSVGVNTVLNTAYPFSKTRQITMLFQRGQGDSNEIENFFKFSCQFYGVIPKQFNQAILIWFVGYLLVFFFFLKRVGLSV